MFVTNSLRRPAKVRLLPLVRYLSEHKYRRTGLLGIWSLHLGPLARVVRTRISTVCGCAECYAIRREL